VILDWVSRPEAFASLRAALAQGYALDALGSADADPPSTEDAQGLVSLIPDAPTSERDGIGLGREVRFAFSRLLGSGLACDEELIQLTVHHDGPGDGECDPSGPWTAASAGPRGGSASRGASLRPLPRVPR
jgi:hypothetical protein